MYNKIFCTFLLFFTLTFNVYGVVLTGCNVSLTTGNYELGDNITDSISNRCFEFIVSTSNIIFDCKGNTLTNPGGINTAFNFNNNNNIEVKNCVLNSWYKGVDLFSSNNNSFLNINMTGNFKGFEIESASSNYNLFKDILYNYSTGVVFDITSGPSNNEFDNINVIDSLVVFNFNNGGIKNNLVKNSNLGNTSTVFNFFHSLELYATNSNNTFYNNNLGNFSNVLKTTYWHKISPNFYENIYAVGTFPGDKCFNVSASVCDIAYPVTTLEVGYSVLDSFGVNSIFIGFSLAILFLFI